MVAVSVVDVSVADVDEVSVSLVDVRDSAVCLGAKTIGVSSAA